MERTPADLLSFETLTAALAGLTGWTYAEASKSIEKEYQRANFLDAVGFIQSIAHVAEAQDHHPDILLHSYKRVRVMLTTHSAGGVTQNDFDLARAIDAL
jgi:4a-hydroxytetrahydrobiopterin dehydratase